MDFELSDEDTCRATIRMFLQCNLVKQFQIPYQVTFVSLMPLSENIMILT